MNHLLRNEFSPFVAIVILNWNKKDYVIKLISQILQSDYQNYEIIVVDNASTDGSVDRIKKAYPDVNLIINQQNLGGTGGFNKGLDYVVNQNKYDFVWLLDNDAEVEKNTLSEMIQVMINNNNFGILGSRINDINDRNITVEAGSMIRRDTIGVKPLFRNTKDLKIEDDFIEVDYVAICSALIRVKALRDVGLMDERYFIFWDDMDWGLNFKKHGYTVACCLKSVVYHSTFTEKRNLIMDYYYSPRNSLLTYSKHTSITKRIFLFYNFLRYYLKLYTLHLFGDNKQISLLGYSAICDFLIGKWGEKKFIYKIPTESLEDNLPVNSKKILIISSGSGSVNDINEARKEIHQELPKSEISILIRDDRTDLLGSDFKEILKINSNKIYNLYYLVYIFFKILTRKFDCAITFNLDTPFSFATLNAYRYNPIEKKFSRDPNNLKNTWKIFASVIIGEFLSIIIVPFVIFSSLKLNRSN